MNSRLCRLLTEALDRAEELAGVVDDTIAPALSYGEIENLRALAREVHRSIEDVMELWGRQKNT